MSLDSWKQPNSFYTLAPPSICLSTLKYAFLICIVKKIYT